MLVLYIVCNSKKKTVIITAKTIKKIPLNKKKKNMQDCRTLMKLGFFETLYWAYLPVQTVV